MLPVKEILFAREVNDIKYVHLNYYIFVICLYVGIALSCGEIILGQL